MGSNGAQTAQNTPSRGRTGPSYTGQARGSAGEARVGSGRVGNTQGRSKQVDTHAASLRSCG